MKTMTKAAWDALRYRAEIQALSEEEGGGWIAFIPLLGKGLFMADGDTPNEALEELETRRRSLYEKVVASGVAIPLPDDATDRPAASGKWLMRTSPRLHAELRAAAEAEGVSLNAYCEEALLRGHAMASAASAMSALAEGILDDARLCAQREMRAARYEVTGVGEGFAAAPKRGPAYEVVEGGLLAA